VSKETFPDYLFTFGEFWTEQANFPIDSDNVIPTGYPYLDERRTRFDDVPTKDQVVFISQGTIGSELSQIAVSLEEDQRTEYPWLASSDVTVVDSDSPTLYRLFAESKAQVGVGSTALYEGLAFGLETYILNLSSSEIMTPLVKYGTAYEVSSKSEIRDSVTKNQTVPQPDIGQFFETSATKNVVQNLRQISRSDHI
jgi:hypothetical protein